MGEVNNVEEEKKDPQLQNQRTTIDREAMLQEMGDLGFGGYGDNYSEFGRQPSTRFGEKGNQIDEQEKIEVENINLQIQNSERERTMSQQVKKAPTITVSSNDTATEIERLPTNSQQSEVPIPVVA